MPVDDLRFLIATVAAGVVVGWGLGRWPENRRAARWATASTALIGAASWVVWAVLDAPGPRLGTAAVALTVGGAVAALVLVGTDRSTGG